MTTTNSRRPRALNWLAAGWLALGAAACADSASSAPPAGDDVDVPMPERVLAAGDYDARVKGEVEQVSELSRAYSAQVADRLGLSSARVSVNPITLAPKSITAPMGHLSEPRAGAPETIALGFVNENLDILGLQPADISGLELTDQVYSKVSGATHLYYSQSYKDLTFQGASLGVSINREGRVMRVGSTLVPNVAEATKAIDPAISPATAVRAVASHLGVDLTAAPELTSQGFGPNAVSVVVANELSLEPMNVRVMLQATGPGEVVPVYQMEVRTTDEKAWYDISVDARTGQIVSRWDWTHGADKHAPHHEAALRNAHAALHTHNSSDTRVTHRGHDHRGPIEPQAPLANAAESYNVFAMPIADPADGSRSVVSNPADPEASPNGWISAGKTITRGNNVESYLEARDAGGAAPPDNSGQYADCGPTLNCNFPLDLNSPPQQYEDASVTNLFYWNNILHDVQWQYGFDEPGGNFQSDTFGRGGRGGDSIRTEAQDGRDSGSANNANMSTPPDGRQPQMQMFIWNTDRPIRDGSFSTVIIGHEYGHGISIRQAGGPSNSSCLVGTQQYGEGTSDWWGLLYSVKDDDDGSRAVVGDWAPRRPNGIRPDVYSTDRTLNSTTYESIRSNVYTVPHGVGSVFGQALWLVTWRLIDEYGIGDIYDAMGGKGNQRAMLYVNEMQKLTACSPTFPEARDALVAAAREFYDGEDVCLIWEEFAKMGIGFDANEGNGGRQVTNGFELPGECNCAVADPRFETPIVDTVEIAVPWTIPGGCDGVAAEGGTLFWNVKGDPSTSGTIDLSVSGQELVGTFPAIEPDTVIEYTIEARGARGAVTTFPRNEADPEYELYFGDTDELFFDDFEAGSAGWTLNGFEVGATSRSPGGDPAEAYSGSAVLSDSLGRDYDPDLVGSSASVTVDGIDVARYESIRLQYRRFLNVEDSIFDQAIITVDGQEVFQNVSRDLPGDNNPDNNFHHRDSEWRFIDIDITDLAQDGAVTLEVSMTSDAGLQFGGWNLDDVAVVGFVGDGGDGGGDGDGDGDGGGDGDGDGDTTGGDGDGDTTGGDGDGGDGDGDGTTTTTGGDDDGTGGSGGGGGGGSDDGGGCSVSSPAPSSSLLAGLFLAMAFITRRPRRKR